MSVKYASLLLRRTSKQQIVLGLRLLRRELRRPEEEEAALLAVVAELLRVEEVHNPWKYEFENDQRTPISLLTDIEAVYCAYCCCA